MTAGIRAAEFHGLIQIESDSRYDAPLNDRTFQERPAFTYMPVPCHRAGVERVAARTYLLIGKVDLLQHLGVGDRGRTGLVKGKGEIGPLYHDATPDECSLFHFLMQVMHRPIPPFFSQIALLSSELWQ